MKILLIAFHFLALWKNPRISGQEIVENVSYLGQGDLDEITEEEALSTTIPDYLRWEVELLCRNLNR